MKAEDSGGGGGQWWRWRTVVEAVVCVGAYEPTSSLTRFRLLEYVAAGGVLSKR